jgi:hypothetical protein
MAASGKRSFWLHQLAEYIVGGAMLASGLQSPKPLIPAIVGSLILLNTAIVDAPFGAFRLVGRRLHRILDYIVLGIATVACAAPGMDVATRLVQILIVIVLAVVILRTNYSAPAPKGKQPVSAVPDGRADEIGRLAGHTAGTWASKIREKSREFKQP